MATTSRSARSSNYTTKPYATDVFFPEDYEYEEEMEGLVFAHLGEQVAFYVSIINAVGLCPVISIFGTMAAIINMVIFKRQGFQDSVNVVLFANSFSDFLTSLTGLFQKIYDNPLLLMEGRDLLPRGVSTLAGEIPHLTALNLGFWFTALATFERCICIALPLKVKEIVTLKGTKIAVIFITSCSLVAQISPVYLKLYALNRELGGNQTFPALRGMLYFNFGLGFVKRFSQFICFGIIIGCSFILVVKLGQKSKWRQKATASNDREDAMKKRDQKVVKMILLVVLVFLMGSLPNLIYFQLLDSEIVAPEFEYTVHAVLCQTIIFLCEALNASVNIFIYYNMSSKYKATFRSIFCRETDGERKKSKS